MSIYHVLQVFKVTAFPVMALRLFVFALAAAMLAGCASSLARIQTWEGEVAEGGRALLKAPGEIQVVRVNGLSMSDFLMDDLALNYDLLPGENQIVFNYKTIWAKTGVVRDGESKVHVVETEPHAVSFVAQAGESYTFEFDKPESRREAEALQERFSGAIVDGAGVEVASFKLWNGKTPGPARAPVSGDQRGTIGTTGGDTLGQLKALWQNASEEEKRTFLRWAFE
ncbi:hypothetical protein MARLIPOL_17388 [Marinobacter lipolyticus SM19]|uniref:DUF2057 domain-containing protein n=1 Tax=Marinobacter lipolyticus SM19 TaxID=1318628 RepID=R8AWL2_9GAMM|nr:DUF2057 family protein [Marinobacter lipolyticus]EON90720.1 hypothetical protein MARLIPOL_17388 [Marinobacter lipolyticus SM19]